MKRKRSDCEFIWKAAKKKQRRKRERFNGNEPREKSWIGKEKKKRKILRFLLR